MRCFSNIMFNFALILHLLVDSIQILFTRISTKKSSELFVDSRKCTTFAPTNPARFP